MDIKRLYSAGAIIIICTIIATIQAASAAPTISVEPSYLSASQGDNFMVNITIDPDDTEVMGAQYDLYFNTTLLNAINQTPGTFLSHDGASTTEAANKINNTLGKIEYGESRISTDCGVTAPGVLAAITFQVIAESGVCDFLLDNVVLSGSDAEEIPSVIVNNSTVEIAQAPPSTPFVIGGYVSYKDGTPCNDPAVNITNLNTSKEWTTETAETSNYYQIMLASCDGVIAGETLRFTATSPDGSQSNTTEHTVTQDEVNAGGIFSFNITLVSLAAPPTLVEYTISNRTITPPQTTEIDVEFSEKVKWKIAIENGGVVHDWTGTSTNPTKKPWNGTYEENDTIVPDGAYIVNITWTNTTTDLGGQNNTECIVVDTTPPTVIGYAPTGTDAPVSTNITAAFNESMNPDTLNNETVTVEHNGTAVNGNITYDASSKTVTFDPAGDLNYSEIYNVTITAGVQDIAGNNISSNVTWNFTTSSRVIEAIISIGNASGNVTVPITIEDATNVGAVDITITYNASVVNVTNVTGGDFDAIVTNLEHVHEGWVRIGTFQTDNPGLTGSIILANVTFRSNSTNGTSSLNLSVTTFKDATNDTNQIPYIVQNGTYTAALNGDVNGDGVVDIADAMYVAKHVLDKSGFEEIIEEAADVNDDGVIDIADAMYLAKHVLDKSGFEELR